MSGSFSARLWAGGLSLLALVAGAGCGHSPPYVWARELPGDDAGDQQIQTGDTLLVEVKDQPTASGEFVVRDDGHYLQPALGSVLVAGLSPDQASMALADRLKRTFVNPSTRVWIVKRPPIKVSVIGEVKTPGSLELGKHRTVVAALAGAGWLTEYAHQDRIYVIRNGDNARRIRFKLSDLVAPEPRTASFRLRDGDVVVAE
jgi:polysaccharide biosynthesis/export protein